MAQQTHKAHLHIILKAVDKTLVTQAYDQDNLANDASSQCSTMSDIYIETVK